MQNKNFKIALLIGVAVVWGLIGYRIYKQFFSPPQADNTPNTAPLNAKKQTKEVPDSLLLNYPDPFLSISYTATAPVKTNHHSIKTNSNISLAPPTTPMPTIAYKGTITAGNKTLVIVELNGSEKLYPLNTLVEGVKVLSANNNSMQVLVNNQKMVVMKK
jgi:hypothetical protein